MIQLTGKTAIVTGASSGIGKAIANALAKERMNVVLVARREEKIKAIAQSINEKVKDKRALAIVADVKDFSQVEHVYNEAIKQFKSVDVYVNNAGAMLSGAVTDGQRTDWEQMIDVNIKGVLYGIHSVLPHMLKRSTGHIINISSVSGFEVTKRSTVYSATKAAVRIISQGLEKELARTGVRLTNISPGMVDTDLTERIKVDRQILKAQDIAKSVIYALTQPHYVNVNEITIRPV